MESGILDLSSWRTFVSVLLNENGPSVSLSGTDMEQLERSPE